MTTAKTSTLAEALAAAQAEMPAVEKDATNPHFKSKFVSLDNLIATTRPVLNKHGLAIVQLPAVSELGAPVLRTTITHTGGEQLSADAPLFLNKQDMQALGAAITYMRRFAWAAACGIASDHDDDGNRASAPGTTRKPPETPPSPPSGTQASALLLDVEAGIARAGKFDPRWTMEAVVGNAAVKFGRPIAFLDELTEPELEQILAAMPAEASTFPEGQ